MPLDDWQFWVVTLIALLVAIKTARTLFPKPKRTHRVGLTIDRQPPARG